MITKGLVSVCLVILFISLSARGRSEASCSWVLRKKTESKLRLASNDTCM